MITNHPVTVMLLIFQESLVVANEHLRFYLLHGLQYYAYDNDQAGTAEGYTCAEHTIKEAGTETASGCPAAAFPPRRDTGSAPASARSVQWYWGCSLSAGVSASETHRSWYP